MTQIVLDAGICRPTCKPNEAVRQRILSRHAEPLFIAAWHRVLMIHFEVDAVCLQREVPFQLDDRSLLTKDWPWFAEARLVGAIYSPGFDTVWMGRPHAARLRP
jgi:hypothetical protein